MTVPDPVTVRIAAQTSFRYDVVHVAVTQLMLLGFNDVQAERAILMSCRSGVSLGAITEAVRQAGSPAAALSALDA